MGEYKTVNYRAICWVPNGKKVYDMWQGKYVEDKEPKEITGTFEYYIDGNGSNYLYKLIELMKSLQRYEGCNYIEIQANGLIRHVFRISKTEEYKKWEDVMNHILNNSKYYYSV